MIRDWLRDRLELTRGEANGNVLPMEGLRGFAVFLVFAVHYVTLIEPWMGAKTPLFSVARAFHAIGNTGVDLFFVLSGYLIYGSLMSKDQSFLPYAYRRIQRIYPVFTAVFCAYVILSFARPGESKIPNESWDALIYLTQNFLLLPGLFPIEPLITVAWSLSYEMLYYLALPFLIWFLALRKKSLAWRVAFFLALTLVLVTTCAVFGGPVRLIMFIAGILLAEVMRHQLIKSPGSVVASVALLTGLLSALSPVQGAFGIALKAACLYVAFFVVCHACFARPLGPLGRTFSLTGLRWLGNMSYSYYLVHGVSLQSACIVLEKFVPPQDRGTFFFLALMPVMFAWTLIPSAVMFMLVERPFSLTPKKSAPIDSRGTRNMPPRLIRGIEGGGDGRSD